MERKSKIEPGCRVVLIRSRHADCPNLWKFGIAQRRVVAGEVSPVGPVFSKEAHGTWLVCGEGIQTRISVRDSYTDEVLNYRWENSGYCIAPDENLMRIDDLDPDVLSIREKEKSHA